MGLSSFLLGPSKFTDATIDKELDDLFKSTATVCNAKTLNGVIGHLTLSPLCLWLPNDSWKPTLFALLSSFNPEYRNLTLNTDTLAPRTRSAYDLHGPSSLFTHKTSATALASRKLTSNVPLDPSPTSSTKKRKKKEDPLTSVETDLDDASAGSKRSTKKAKLGSHHDSSVGSTPVATSKLGKRKTKGERNPIPEAVKKKGKSEEKEAGKDKRGNKQAPVITASDDEDGDETVEDSEQSSSSDSEEDDDEYVPPVHESLAGTSGPDSAPSSKKNKKYVPPDETPDQRDSRTIFVGNVPSQIMAAKVSWHYTSLPAMSVNRFQTSLVSIAFDQAI